MDDGPDGEPRAGDDSGAAAGSPPDEPGARFDRVKQRVGLIAGPVLALLAYLASSDSVAPALPALMALCVTWWLTETLPPAVVALLAACGAVLFGLATPKQAFGAFGSPLRKPTTTFRPAHTARPSSSGSATNAFPPSFNRASELTSFDEVSTTRSFARVQPT